MCVWKWGVLHRRNGPEPWCAENKCSTMPRTRMWNRSISGTSILTCTIMNPYTDCIATSKKMVLLAQCLNVVFLVTYFAIFFRVFFNKHQTCGGLGVLPVSETAGALVDQDRSCELVGVAWDEKDGPVIKISHTMWGPPVISWLTKAPITIVISTIKP